MGKTSMASEERKQTVILEEEEEVFPPLSPLSQCFSTSTLSIANIAVLEFEIHPIDEYQTVEIIRNILLPLNTRFYSIIDADETGLLRWKKVEVRVEDHVVVPTFPIGLLKAEYEEHLREYLSKIVGERLLEGRPLWEVHALVAHDAHDQGDGRWIRLDRTDRSISLKTPRAGHVLCVSIGLFSSFSPITLCKVPSATALRISPFASHCRRRLCRCCRTNLYVATCSLARDVGADYVAWGHSTLVGPFGEVLATTEHDEAIVIAEIDYSQMELRRTNLPLQKQRRGDLYQLIDIQRLNSQLT